jgi:AcrR family transcriptional regulator
MPYRVTARCRARRQEIERRVQRAAHAVVVQKGFEGARLGDVAKAAGISPTAIYRFAQSRDELLADVLRHVSARERDAFRAALSAYARPRDAVSAATRQFVERAFAGNAIATVLLSGPAVPAVDRARHETRLLLAETISERLGSRSRSTAIVGVLLAVLADALQPPGGDCKRWAREISSLCASLV